MAKGPRTVLPLPDGIAAAWGLPPATVAEQPGGDLETADGRVVVLLDWPALELAAASAPCSPTRRVRTAQLLARLRELP